VNANEELVTHAYWVNAMRKRLNPLPPRPGQGRDGWEKRERVKTLYVPVEHGDGCYCFVCVGERQ
jgi:hypothetical protein